MELAGLAADDADARELGQVLPVRDLNDVVRIKGAVLDIPTILLKYLIMLGNF